MRKSTEETSKFVEQSIWARADRFLASALNDTTQLCTRIDKLAKKVPGHLEKSWGVIEGDALLVRQSIIEAATLRGLSTFGSPGETCRFDPLLHDIAGAGKKPRRGAAVRIKTSGVRSQVNGGVFILIRAKAAIVKSRTGK